MKPTSSRYDSTVYNAVKLLRERFLVYEMMTATPLDNTWIDCFAYISLLRGHDFTSVLRMRQIFTDAYDKKRKYPELCYPKGISLLRLVRPLQAAILVRLVSVILGYLAASTHTSRASSP